MKVEYSSTDEQLQVTVSDDSDWRLFNGIADAILKKFKGKLVEQLDGIDERYWDIEIGGRVVTLHLDYTCISLFSQKGEANDLVEEIAKYLESVEPKRLFREMFYVRNFFRIRRRR